MLLRWIRRLGLLLVLIGGCFYWASCTTTPVPSPGVIREVRSFTLAGHPVLVTLYHPPQGDSAPVVIVAHGFTRSRRHMEGWGTDISALGFRVAVLDQPAFSNHKLNGQALADLARQLGKDRRVGLVGFSMGGLTTLLAAANQPVDAWVGLDPVDMNGSGVRAAPDLTMPCAILRAEPQAWNMQGNARGLLKALRAPHFALKVRSASHVDAESPTDLLGQLACGFTDPGRQALFKRYAIAFLQATLMQDPKAWRVLEQARQDPGLADVVMSGLAPAAR